MFCPKCGQQNPETGKFCRSCGTDLGNVAHAMTGALPAQPQLLDHKGKPVSWDRAIVKLFSGVAFIVVAIALALTGKGQNWWFWMLIPGFMGLGAGFAQFIQLRKAEKGLPVYSPSLNEPAGISGARNSSLPAGQTQWAGQAESRYKTGDLVPPSVTDGTTRHLEMDPEARTMTLPKK
jgi:hypothetical protein